LDIAKINKSHYYAVIFNSVLKENADGYHGMADRMLELAAQQPGFLGFESARNEIGITVSYWDDLESIKNWKENGEHLLAQKMGKEKWYKKYALRICKVEKQYYFDAE
jgi:heme-degrading monooxygenase HmoA